MSIMQENRLKNLQRQEEKRKRKEQNLKESFKKIEDDIKRIAEKQRRAQENVKKNEEINWLDREKKFQKLKVGSHSFIINTSTLQFAEQLILLS